MAAMAYASGVRGLKHTHCLVSRAKNLSNEALKKIDLTLEETVVQWKRSVLCIY